MVKIGFASPCAGGLTRSLMDRIADTFARAKDEGRACFVAYVCAGDPDFETSVKVCRALLENGVDLLELGVPFSDPLADGPTNQLAAQRALESGMTCDRVFDLVRAIRAFSEAPIVLYTYFNLVFARGEETYIRQARDAGADGLLTLDLPPEEASEVVALSRKHGMKNIFIVAPTTPPERVSRIAESAGGFIYYVSREGVTGVQQSLAANLKEAVEMIRQKTSIPVAVGFGISTPEQVREVGAIADGVVVGSALVNRIKDNLDTPDAIPDAIRDTMRRLTGRSAAETGQGT
jgi:tryptophan synthase alpha chain